MIAEVTGAALDTLNVRLIIGAAEKLVLPDWFAVTVQLPTAKEVNTFPVTVHTDGVVLAKATGRPELALAVSDIVAPTVCGPGEAKVIVCAVITGPGLVTLNVRLTIGAAAKIVLPDWFAVTMQLPTLKDVNTVPVTVHTVGVVLAKTTGRPELALALSDAVTPTICGPGEAKLIVCAVGTGPELGATVNDLVTLTAALYVALPLWSALRLQVPDASNTKVLPLTVQTTGVVEVIETGRPELEVATNAGVTVPMVWLPGDAKVMVWVVNGGTGTPVNPKAI